MQGDAARPRPASWPAARRGKWLRGRVGLPAGWRAALLALGLAACSLLATAPPALADGANSTWATRVVIVPGLGLCTVELTAFYADLRARLKAALPNVAVELRRMPDCVRVHRSYWLPFMRDVLKIDNSTIIVGHSAGAVAAMRYAEHTPVAGIILAAPYYTAMNIPTLQQSGWYNGPWLWDSIRSNAGFITQFSSTNDPLVPWNEQQYVADNLRSELNIMRKGHFLRRSVPEIAEAIIKKFQ